MADDTPVHEIFELPANTPQYVCQSEKQCCSTLLHGPILLKLDQTDHHNQYIFFSNVDEKTCDQYSIVVLVTCIQRRKPVDRNG